jgi:hypothetical protein
MGRLARQHGARAARAGASITGAETVTTVPIDYSSAAGGCVRRIRMPAPSGLLTITCGYAISPAWRRDAGCARRRANRKAQDAVRNTAEDRSGGGGLAQVLCSIELNGDAGK